MQDNTQQNLIKIENATSNNYIEINKIIVPAFSNVSLELHQGESWVVMSKYINTARIFCATIANLLSIKSGKITVNNKTLTYKKNSLTEDVFYIDSADMLFDDMNVLEYLMYVNCSSKTEYHERLEMQKAYLDLLVDLGLENIALTRIDELTDGEKIIITILVAILSNSKIIVVDINKYKFNVPEIPRMMQIVDYAKENDKLIVVSTNVYEIARVSGDNVLYFNKGELAYAGAMDELISNNGDVVCEFTANDPEQTIEKFESIASDYKYELIGDVVYVHNVNNLDYNPTQIIELMTKNRIVLKTVNYNVGKLENALLLLDKKMDNTKDLNERK